MDNFPLRLFSVTDWLDNETVIFKKPDNWHFCIISHTWGENIPEWNLEFNSYNIIIKAFKKNDLTIAAKCIKKLNFEWLWIDNICIDQNSTSEKQREIIRMGYYYSRAKICLIFTQGLYNIGDFLNTDHSIPRWYTRIWTLQEAVRSTNKFYLHKVDKNDNVKHNAKLQKIIDNKKNVKHEDNLDIEIKIEWIDNNDKYFVIEHKYIKKAIEVAAYRIQENNNNIPVPAKIIHIIKEMLDYTNTVEWTIPNIIRECGKRKATKEEDVVYGIL